MRPSRADLHDAIPTAVPDRSSWIDRRIAVLCGLWSCWLAFSYVVFGASSFVRLWDNGDSYVPARIAVGRMLAEGQLGYWNPEWASGVDLLSSGLGPLLDVLFFALTPGWLAYGVTMWLQRFLAAYFTYRLLRESLHLSPLAALYPALAFSLLYQPTMDFWHAAGFTLFDGFGLPGLPFLLWALGRIDLRHRSRSYLEAAALGVVLSWTSYFHFSLFFLPLIAFWFLFVIPIRTSRFWTVLGTFVGAWLLAGAPALWATIANAPQSQRADWRPDGPIPVIEGWAHQVRYFRQVAWDNAAALGIVVAAWVLGRARDRRLLAVCAALALGMLFYVGTAFVQQRFAGQLGFVGGFDFSRIRNLFPFLLMVAAGVALFAISQRRARVATVLGGLATVLLVAQSMYVNAQVLVGEALGDYRTSAMQYQHPDLVQLAAMKDRVPPFRVATIDHPYQKASWAWAYRLETVDGYINLYSGRYREFWEQVVGPLTASRRDFYDLLHYWGNQVYLFAPSSTPLRIDAHYRLPLLSLANTRYVISRVPLDHDDLVLVPSLVDEERDGWSDLREPVAELRGITIEQPDKLRIYENRRVFPRYFLVGQARVFDDATGVLSALGTAPDEDLRASAYLARADVVHIPLEKLAPGDGDVRLVKASSDDVSLAVTCVSPSILIATNTYSPYWQARVDGVRASVFPVDHAFQAVYLDAGSHVVTLEYRPPYAVRWR